MGFYNRFILPHVIELAMRLKTFAPFRERVVGAARGLIGNAVCNLLRRSKFVALRGDHDVGVVGRESSTVK